MTKFKVNVIQTFVVTRSIVTEIEGDSVFDAIEAQECDFAPSFDDPRWVSSYDFQSEKVMEG